MEKIVTENLFLMEFLVDNLDLGKNCQCDAPPGETCVSFQFLDNAPLDVCETDFDPVKQVTATGEVGGSVKSGKSCLFSLSPEQANAGTEQFDICVSVMRKMQPGWLPEKVEIGTSVISIANLFNELITSVELSDGSSPTAKTLKDVFDINDAGGKAIGKISVYIRMSCFGKLIVTQFQMDLDDKSVLFKDKAGKSLYRYKKAGKKKGGGGPYISETGGGAGSPGGYKNPACPQVPCMQPGAGPMLGQQMPQPGGGAGGGYVCPFGPCAGSPGSQFSNSPMREAPTSGGYLGGSTPAAYGTQTMMTPCNECGFVANAPCLPQMAGPMIGYSEMAASVPPPPSPPPEGNYQEIGASMGGNSLTIRVHKDKGKAEQVDPNAFDDCICIGENGPSGALVPAGKQQQAFAIRPGAGPDTPFSFRLGQCGDTAGRGDARGGNDVVVNPPVYTAADGTQFTEFSDPNKETFILRIGKKSEGADKKNNLELELQTPKGPPLKPIPKKETVETQYDPLDAGVDDSGGKGKKGKGGKKDKGGKKGKGGKGKKKK